MEKVHIVLIHALINAYILNNEISHRLVYLRLLYEEVWTAIFGKEVPTEVEFGNTVDHYATDMKKYSGDNVHRIWK